MPTINEISKLTGFSVSTVSIVLRGDGDKRSISKDTQEKVLSAAKKIGYTVNVSARRLRAKDEEQLPIVAILWSDDFRSTLMVRFLRGIKRAMNEENINCELRVIPYKPGKLSEVINASFVLSNSGVIVCNASYEDLEFMESSHINLPVVLYNRSSNCYSSVVVDNTKLGTIPFNILMSHGRKNICVLDYLPEFPGKRDRVESFVDCADRNGIEVIRVCCEENDARSAYLSIKNNIELIKKSDSMFITSDIVALGAIKALFDEGMKPNLSKHDYDLISIGIGDPEICEFMPLSISTVELPMEEMAKNCLIVLYKQIINLNSDPEHIEMEVKFVERESCTK